MAIASRNDQSRLKFSKKLGNRIREHRTAKGWSQEELAVESGFYRTYIGRVENGTMAVSVYTVWQLAKALKTDLGTLLKDL